MLSKFRRRICEQIFINLSGGFSIRGHGGAPSLDFCVDLSFYVTYKKVRLWSETFKYSATKYTKRGARRYRREVAGTLMNKAIDPNV